MRLTTTAAAGGPDCGVVGWRPWGLTFPVGLGLVLGPVSALGLLGVVGLIVRLG